MDIRDYIGDMTPEEVKSEIIEPIYQYMMDLLSDKEHRLKVILATDAAEYLYALKKVEEGKTGAE